MEMRFDPMTGEPIVPQGTDGQQEAGAGAQTAGVQPEADAGAQTAGAQPVYAPQTPVNGKKNWIKGLGIAAAAVVVVIVVAAIVKNAVIGKGGKVLIATANTFKDTPTIVKEANLDSAAKLIADGKYSVTAGIDVSGDGFEGKFVSTPKEKQISGSVDIEGVSADGVIGLTDKELKAYIPLISDDTYVYNFEGDDQEGYIVDSLEDAGIDIGDVNEALRQLSDIEDKTSGRSTKQLEKNLLKEFNSLKWEKTGKESLKVDGKTRRIKGLKADITSDDVESMVGVIEDYYKEQFDDMDYLKDLNIGIDDIDQLFDEIYSACDYMDDIDAEFYIYKNKLAAVYLDMGSTNVEILFEGGDYRLQNVECNIENDWEDMSFEIDGSSKGSVENLEFIVDSYTALELEYDSKSGDYTLGIGDDEVDGTLKKNGKGFDFSVDYDELSLSLTLSGDTKLEKYEGDEIDITELDQDDIIDIVSDIYGSMF